MRRLRKAKKEAAPMEKPDVVKTHLRNMIILPEMIGSMVGVYNGKTFNQVEIKVGACYLINIRTVLIWNFASLHMYTLIKQHVLL